MTEIVVGPAQEPCAAVAGLLDAEARGLPVDALVRCYRAEHGEMGHEGIFVYAHDGGGLGAIKVGWNAFEQAVDD